VEKGADSKTFCLKEIFFIIFLLIEVSGHGVGFALVLANYCFMAPTGQPRLSKKSLKF
jgi:hypothetical protein